MSRLHLSLGRAADSWLEYFVEDEEDWRFSQVYSVAPRTATDGTDYSGRRGTR